MPYDAAGSIVGLRYTTELAIEASVNSYDALMGEHSTDNMTGFSVSGASYTTILHTPSDLAFSRGPSVLCEFFFHSKV